MKTSFPVAALGCLLASRVALATLGGDVSSVESDRVRMKAAAVTTTESGPYTVHSMQTPSGTTVREFANADGTVFAVTWQGPFPPDLRQTLGTYFQKYQTAPRARRYGHSHDTVEQPDLVVHSSGHLRAFSGSAYVPQLVPAGVSIDQLLQSNQ
jgi:hypothetical protein